MVQLGKLLVGAGILLILAGSLKASGHLSWLGKLPGDLSLQKESFSFYFPLTTCILLSVLVTLVMNLFRK